MRQVSVERVLPVQLVSRMRPAVVPGTLVHRVDAEHLQLAAFNLRCQRMNHAAVFVLMKTPARGRERPQPETRALRTQAVPCRGEGKGCTT